MNSLSINYQEGVKNGTSYRGAIKMDYQSLEDALGKPEIGSGDGKVQASWTLSNKEGQVVTVYDYKQSDKHYTEITEWHVGGKHVTAKQALEMLDELVREEVGMCIYCGYHESRCKCEFDGDVDEIAEVLEQTETTTLELTELEVRALRAAIQWSEMLAQEGKLELYDWQVEAFKNLKERL